MRICIPVRATAVAYNSRNLNSIDEVAAYAEGKGFVLTDGIGSVINAVFKLGSHTFDQPLVLAPMAGVSDRVFRAICLDYGADYAVSEMIISNPKLRNSHKTTRRLDNEGIDGIRITQIAGAEPQPLADAARYAVAEGAEVIDINMGCPAKKVCNKAAGSALMKDERLVARLLTAVVAAVDVPVTLKTRTGWDLQQRNAVVIARIAEQSGIQLLTIHGRSRACAFKGAVEYDTIAAVKSTVNIPVIANGDIDSAERARDVLRYTECDGLMIGRAANGNPWLFSQIKKGLEGNAISAPTREQVCRTLVHHVSGLHDMYGEHIGSRVARKHVGWYARHFQDGEEFRRRFNRIETAQQQRMFLNNYHNNPQGALAA